MLKRNTPLRARATGEPKKRCCREHVATVTCDGEQMNRKRLACPRCDRIFIHWCADFGPCVWRAALSQPKKSRTPKQRRERARSVGRRDEPDPDAEPEYLDWVRTQPCCAAGLGHPCRGVIQAHHPRHAEAGGVAPGKARKCPDRRAFALCAEHHVGAGLHNLGGPFKGWKRDRIRAWSDVQSMTTRAKYLVMKAGEAVDDLARTATPEEILN